MINCQYEWTYTTPKGKKTRRCGKPATVRIITESKAWNHAFVGNKEMCVCDNHHDKMASKVKVISAETIKQEDIENSNKSEKVKELVLRPIMDEFVPACIEERGISIVHVKDDNFEACVEYVAAKMKMRGHCVVIIGGNTGLTASMEDVILRGGALQVETLKGCAEEMMFEAKQYHEYFEPKKVKRPWDKGHKKNAGGW